jgi:monoamine oxidase
MKKQPSVTIVGGGLSGLVVAYRLIQLGIGFTLFEANSRFGGRILSTSLINGEQYDVTHPAVDLGPSWFWPGQSHFARLIQELGLANSVYAQASTGNSVMEYGDGSIESGRGSASMAGSYRLSGGLYHLVQRLIEVVAVSATDALISKATVKLIRRNAFGLVAVVERESGPQEIGSQEVVLALPPRLVARTIAFEPELSDEYAASLLAIPTWMAGQAKLVAVYDKPFWQDKGLSGDALSQLGPLVEIHDASPKTGGPYALFGFVGVPVAHRSNAERIKAEAVSQLTRLFGEQAANPMAIHLKDWAADSLTSTDLDHHAAHRHVSSAIDLTTVPGLDVIWAGTETAEATNHTNGYLEGAVEAGERAASILAQRFNVPTLTSDEGDLF